jgi:hypothetical protein
MIASVVVVAAAVAVSAVSLSPPAPARQHQRHQLTPDMEVVRSRLLTTYIPSTNVSGLDEDVAVYIALAVPPGVFSDLDLTQQPATGWDGYTMCLRMSEMGSAYWAPAR